MNSLYPLFFKLENKPVLVVGGGKVAEQKVIGLLDVKASVTVIAPHLTKRLEKLALERRLTSIDALSKRRMSKVSRSSSVRRTLPPYTQEIFHEATFRNIPVNIVDVPDLCNFYLASVFQNGDLKVAVSTTARVQPWGK